MKTVQGVEKPLVEWTLKDLKEFCGIYGCNDCPIKNTVCARDPTGWILEEKPKFTAQEIEDAKTLNRTFRGGVFSISRDKQGFVLVGFDMDNLGGSFLRLSDDSFPSIKLGMTYYLQDIMGDFDV